VTVNRSELPERYGRVYGELGLAIGFTNTNDPKKGDPKAVLGSWDKTKPLQSAIQGERMMGASLTRNPVVVLRPSGLIGVENDTPEGLKRIESLELPETVTVRSSEPWKRHYWFRPSNGRVPQYVAFRFEEAGVSADTGRYFLCPPAVHPSGAINEFLASPEEVEIAALPEDRYEELVRLYRETESGEREQTQIDPEAKIKPGSRRKMIFRYACQQRRWSASEEEIVHLALVGTAITANPR
jgi:Bifunctional DNA primase/polymerase, N-terminal